MSLDIMVLGSMALEFGLLWITLAAEASELWYATLLLILLLPIYRHFIQMKATKNNVIEERFVVLIVREVLTALSFLHKSRVIHRDIKGIFHGLYQKSGKVDAFAFYKAANVLLTSAGRILLCDFGVSALLSTTHSKRTTFVGTPYWMAPEVISSGSLYDTKADIWSLGITIYEMITGSPPHADQEAMRALVLIPKSKPPKLPENDGSRDMKDFMATCLKELPADVRMLFFRCLPFLIRGFS
jgi:serine/threonine protein kinase